MERCPLCNSELEDGSCPVCSSLSGVGGDTLPVKSRAVDPAFLERTLRDRKEPPPEPVPPPEPKLSPEEERAAWYAAAGLPVPDKAPPVREPEPDVPLPELTREDPNRGYGAAALILFAQAISGLLVMIIARRPSIFGTVDIVCGIAAGFGLLKGYGFARFLMLASAALHIAECATGVVLTGSWTFFLSALPSVALVAAFFLDVAGVRLALVIVGIVSSFTWVFFAARTPPSADAVMRRFEVPGGRFSDSDGRYSLQAPPGVALYDGQKMVEALQKPKGGLLGKLADEPARRTLAERLIFTSEDHNAAGALSALEIPPHVTFEAMLPSLNLLNPDAVSDDQIIPESIRSAGGLEAQAWRSRVRTGTRELLLVRAKDGRLIALHCTYAVPIAQRICGKVFEGLTVTP